MELNIKNKDNQEVIVTAGKEKIIINIGDDALENNINWNTKSINEFLVNIAAQLNLEDKLEIKVENSEEENKIFNHIVSLFNAFVEKYNENV